MLKFGKMKVANKEFYDEKKFKKNNKKINIKKI